MSMVAPAFGPAGPLVALGSVAYQEYMQDPNLNKAMSRAEMIAELEKRNTDSSIVLLDKLKASQELGKGPQDKLILHRDSRGDMHLLAGEAQVQACGLNETHFIPTKVISAEVDVLQNLTVANTKDPVQPIHPTIVLDEKGKVSKETLGGVVMATGADLKIAAALPDKTNLAQKGGDLKL
jgi:hypothetical protein